MIKISKYYFILFITLFNSAFIFSQKRSLYDYFPHHVGDVWEYVTHEGPNITRNKYFISKIATVPADTAKYIYWGNSSTPGVKVKLNDSSTVYMYSLWDGWVPYYKFNAPFKSYWNTGGTSYQYLDTLIQVNYLGKITDGLVIYSYNNDPKLGTGSITAIKWYLKGIGFYSSQFDVGLQILSGCIIDGIQYGSPVGIEKERSKLVKQNNLQNYPNPFNSQTKIVYQLSTASNISIRVCDILGREVEIIDEGYKEAGSYTKFWNPHNIASGTYIIFFHSPNSLITRKIIYLK